MIRTPDADIKLTQVMVAAPCNAFSQFCAGRAINGAELKAALQFLSDGQRGFYATLCGTHQDEPTISAGDSVLLMHS